MRLNVLRRAEKQIKKLPKLVQLALAQQVQELLGGRVTSEKKLKGYENMFRLRMGNYRAVYEKREGDIYLLLVEHRKDVYSSLERLFG